MLSAGIQIEICNRKYRLCTIYTVIYLQYLYCNIFTVNNEFSLFYFIAAIFDFNLFMKNYN